MVLLCWLGIEFQSIRAGLRLEELLLRVVRRQRNRGWGLLIPLQTHRLGWHGGVLDLGNVNRNVLVVVLGMVYLDSVVAILSVAIKMPVEVP